ncbi:unnamed protein product [Polarella glacialis]|uniref:Thiopurine S-methyltransferase n=1 Tax=Polarella glacialis TaxID=89957 RepID=A0A813J731_POLGL|nr:unnamed protein product [Polarella glacialis]
MTTTTTTTSKSFISFGCHGRHNAAAGSMSRRLKKWLDLWEGDPKEDTSSLSAVSPALERHFLELTADLSHSASVLVPLCGRSFDLAWLAQQGLQVAGVECSRRAIALFAAEQGFELHAGDSGGVEGAMIAWYAGPCTLFEGDWFDATPELLGGCYDLAFDRDALMTVDPARRRQYADVLTRMLRAGTRKSRLLVLAAEFEEASVDAAVTALGPHSLSPAEIQDIFPDFSLEILSEEEAIDTGAFSRLRRAGLRSIIQRAVLLKRENFLAY